MLLNPCRAALHHPDKVGAGISDDYFVRLQLAQETLIKPTLRQAYDRFGPDVLAWQNCVTTREYLVAGLQAYGPTYIGSAIVLTVMGVTGWLQWGRFVR